MAFKNKEDERAYFRTYQRERREEINVAKRARRAANPEQYREREAQWSAADPERILAKNQKWATANAENIREKHKRWRREAIELLGGKCVRCKCSDIRCLQIDHIIPICKSQGRKSLRVCLDIIKGKIENVQILCANCHAIKTYEEDKEA